MRPRLPLDPLLERIVALMGRPLHEYRDCPVCLGDTHAKYGCLKVPEIR